MNSNISEKVLVSAKGTKLRQKGLRQRALIIEHAKSMISTAGVSNLTLRQLASDIDIKLGHLQYYFETKEDLLLEVLVALYEEDESAFLADSSSASFQDILMSLLKLWGSKNTVVYHSILTHYGRQPRYRRLKRRIYKGFYEMLMNAVAAESPEDSKDRLMSKARLITALLDGAMLQEFFDSKPSLKAQKSRFYSEVVRTAKVIANM